MSFEGSSGAKRSSKESSSEEENVRRDVSRRTFLNAAGALGAAATVTGIVGGPTLLDAAEGMLDEKGLIARSDELALNIQESYGISVHFDDTLWKDVSSTKDTWLAERVQALEQVDAELATYPKVLFDIGPRSVTLRNALYLNGQKDTLDMSIEGVTGQRGAGSKEDIIVDVGGKLADQFHTFGWDTAETVRETFTHEFFHSIDRFDNDAWVAMFGQGGGPSLLNHDNAVPGYAIGYGMTNAMEDKATVYQKLASGDPDFIERCKTDQVLAAKVTTLQEYMTMVSDGLIDREYWMVKNKPAFRDHASEYFKQQAQRVLGEPVEAFHARHPRLVHAVQNETYQGWQERLRKEYA